MAQARAEAFPPFTPLVKGRAADDLLHTLHLAACCLSRPHAHTRLSPGAYPHCDRPTQPRHSVACANPLLWYAAQYMARMSCPTSMNGVGRRPGPIPSPYIRGHCACTCVQNHHQQYIGLLGDQNFLIYVMCCCSQRQTQYVLCYL